MSDIDEPKDHHYVPAFYLKKWTRPEANNKLIEFRKVYDGRIIVKEASERATGYKRFLYSRSTADPMVRNHSLESGYMSKLDNGASTILNLFLSGSQDLAPKQRNIWAKFMLVLMMRSPEEMDASSDSYDVASKLSSEEHEEWYRSVRDPNSPATFFDLISKLPVHEAEEAKHDALVKFFDHTKVIPLFSSLKWNIRKLNGTKLPLLTSDRPVFCNNRLSFADGLVFMPLSPDTVFFAQPASADMHPTLGPAASDNEVMRFCNKKIVAQANQYVWANHHGHRLFVERHLGSGAIKSFNQVALQTMKNQLS